MGKFPFISVSFAKSIFVIVQGMREASLKFHEAALGKSGSNCHKLVRCQSGPGNQSADLQDEQNTNGMIPRAKFSNAQ